MLKCLMLLRVDLRASVEGTVAIPSESIGTDMKTLKILKS
jgi:hypothetical protein